MLSDLPGVCDGGAGGAVRPCVTACWDSVPASTRGAAESCPAAADRKPVGSARRDNEYTLDELYGGSRGKYVHADRRYTATRHDLQLVRLRPVLLRQRAQLSLTWHQRAGQGLPHLVVPVRNPDPSRSRGLPCCNTLAHCCSLACRPTSEGISWSAPTGCPTECTA